MSGKATGQVWEMDLPRPTKYLLLALAEHANHDGEQIYPGIELLAWKTGYTARNVQRMLRELEDLGVIVPDEPIKGGAGHTTCYRIDFEAASKLPPRPRKRVKSPHTKTTQKGEIPAHQKGEIPAQLLLEKGEIPTHERVTSPHKKGDISSRARTSIELNRQEPSKGTVLFSAEAEEVVLAFCEITNSEFMAMPVATVQAQEGVAEGLLAKYQQADIEGCMRWLKTWRRVPWTMATVGKEIDEWIAKGRPVNGRIEAPPRLNGATSTVVSRADGSVQRRIMGRD